MIEGRYRHSSVAIRNKLFIFGSYVGKVSKSCEVFDSSCKKFVMLKLFPSTLTFDLSFAANTTFSIGNKIVIISYNSSTALCYDVEKDEWSKEIFNLTKDRSFFGCTLVPHIKF